MDVMTIVQSIVMVYGCKGSQSGQPKVVNSHEGNGIDGKSTPPTVLVALWRRFVVDA